MDVLEVYQVEFSRKKFFTKVYPEISTINEALDSYISEHDNLVLADALLKEINAVLEGIKTSGGWDTQGLLLAKIAASETKIYNDFGTWANNNNVSPDFTFPTIDFKLIVEAWRNFLQE